VAVHADETYWTTDGARTYLWVHGDEKSIHFQYDTSRTGQVSRDILGDDVTGTLVPDCYSGYFSSAAAASADNTVAALPAGWQETGCLDSLCAIWPTWTCPHAGPRVLQRRIRTVPPPPLPRKPRSHGSCGLSDTHMSPCVASTRPSVARQCGPPVWPAGLRRAESAWPCRPRRGRPSLAPLA
jgi:hypothetical protein